jgi:hypothetical protein
MDMRGLHAVGKLPPKIGLAGAWEAIQHNQSRFRWYKFSHLYTCIAEVALFGKF